MFSLHNVTKSPYRYPPIKIIDFWKTHISEKRPIHMSKVNLRVQKTGKVAAKDQLVLDLSR